MCGIWALLGGKGSTEEAAHVKKCLAKLGPRGPDTSRIVHVTGSQAGKGQHLPVTLAFSRLAINGLTPAGMQPFAFTPGNTSKSAWNKGCSVDTVTAPRAPSVFAICNGEIYNYKALAARYSLPLQPGSSDCQVLCPLYESVGGDARAFARCLDGVFAIVLVDEARGRVVAVRDPYGVRPMFTARVGDAWAFSSELKALACIPGVTHITRFLPGTARAWDLASGVEIEAGTQAGEEAGLGTWFTPHWLKNPSYGPGPSGRAAARSAVRLSLDAAVRKRLLVADVPVGCLLSGGLDSSLVAALAQRASIAAGRSPAALHTFSIGMAGSSDCAHARMVAEHIGSTHHEVLVTQQQFLDAIPEVVAAIESFDITSVRASVGNYLVSKYIKEHTDVVVVLNGDGSDEASGSYLYFYAAPTDEAFELEVDRLLRDIHIFDVLRSDRCVAAHGLEPRTPFLDRQFVATYTSIDTGHRRPFRYPCTDQASGLERPAAAEKQLLREAFDPAFTAQDVSSLGVDGACPLGEVSRMSEGKRAAERGLEAGALPSGFPYTLLPRCVLWRRKEAFSDGVSSPEKPWYEVVQEHAERQFVGGEGQWKGEAARYPPGPTQPYTAESVWYRSLFEACYGSAPASTIPYFWLPQWSDGARDPSARTLAVYAAGATPSGPTSVPSPSRPGHALPALHMPSTALGPQPYPVSTGVHGLYTKMETGRGREESAGCSGSSPTALADEEEEREAQELLWEKVAQGGGC